MIWLQSRTPYGVRGQKSAYSGSIKGETRRRTPYGVRGQKYLYLPSTAYAQPCRTPYGVRGQKFFIMLAISVTATVALLTECVDRNTKMVNVNPIAQSRTPYGVRGQKCEQTYEKRLGYERRTPYGVRGQKSVFVDEVLPGDSRTPYGVRGQKFRKLILCPVLLVSHSLRSAWIEISSSAYFVTCTFVALLTECVDRNNYGIRRGSNGSGVALLTECVDRN